MEIYTYPITLGSGFANPVNGYALTHGVDKGWAYRLVMGLLQANWFFSRSGRRNRLARRKYRKIIHRAVNEYLRHSSSTTMLRPSTAHWVELMLQSGWRIRRVAPSPLLPSYRLESN